MKTLLAVHALEPKNGGSTLTVTSRSTPGGEVVTLNPRSPFAFANRADRLVVSSSWESVGRALRLQDDPRTASNFDRIRASYFPAADSFVIANLKAIGDFAVRNRDALARRAAGNQGRPIVSVGHDIDEAIRLFAIFDTAYFATTAEPGFRSVSRVLGLVRSTPTANGAGRSQ